MLYLDSSALVKLYTNEPERDAVDALLTTHAGLLFTSIVTYPEVLSALCRVHRNRQITDREYSAAKSRFSQNWREILVIHLPQEVLTAAERLIESHGLRGFDAVHLCSASWLEEPAVRFACFDQRLRAAAEAEGLIAVP